MEALIDALRRVLGDGWLLVVALAIVGIGASGIVPKWLGERHAAQTREREIEAEDRRQLIENYEAEATNQRRWRAEDAERYERRIVLLEERIARQEQTIARLAQAVELSERGNSRLRHLLGNLFQHIAAQRDLERRRGFTPLAYDGWRDGLGLSADLDEKLRALFDDVSERPPS